MSLGEAPPAELGRPRPLRHRPTPSASAPPRQLQHHPLKPRPFQPSSPAVCSQGMQFMVCSDFLMSAREFVVFTPYKSLSLFFPRPQRLLRVPRTDSWPPDLQQRPPGSPPRPRGVWSRPVVTQGARPRRHGDARGRWRRPRNPTREPAPG